MREQADAATGRSETVGTVSPLFDHWLTIVRKHGLGLGAAGWIDRLPPEAGTSRMEQLAAMCRQAPALIAAAANKLESEAHAIDSDLRSSLYDALEGNDFAAVRQIAMLLDVNRLAATFFACSCMPDSEPFRECADRLLASSSPEERMRTDALTTLGPIDTREWF